METETRTASPKKRDCLVDYPSLANQLIAQAQPGVLLDTAPAAVPNPTVNRQVKLDAEALLARLHPEQCPLALGSIADKAGRLRVEDTAPVNQFASLLKMRQGMLARLGQELDTTCGAQLPQSAVADVQATFIQIGPFAVRPAIGSEVPIGRGYQPLPFTSISRLAGYVGRDEYGLYVREVPDMPEHGLRPSKCGVWVRQPGERTYLRLAPGEAARVTRQSTVRIGGNGISGAEGLEILVR